MSQQRITFEVTSLEAAEKLVQFAKKELGMRCVHRPARRNAVVSLPNHRRSTSRFTNEQPEPTPPAAA